MNTRREICDVPAAQRGEAGAWERLVRSWMPVIHEWCARLGGPSVDPCDATQDVLVVFYKRIHRVQSPERFPSWAFGVTRRILAQHRRRAWVKRWSPFDWREPVETRVGPEESAALSERGRMVWDVLARLPSSQREVLVLCDVEERSSSEVAALLDIPAGTVRSRLRLGRARFAKEAGALDVVEDLAGAGWSGS